MKHKIDRLIIKLQQKGILDVIDLFLVSPEAFQLLKLDFNRLPLKYHAGLDKYYFEYKGVKILPYEKIKGNTIFPYINPAKLS